MSLLSIGLGLADRGMLPDPVIRRGIRRLCGNRLETLAESNGEASREFARSMREGPIAPVPHAANEQHYEVPPDFYGLVLGPHRKYSGCHWPDGTTVLADAEASALEQTCERARLSDGQRILELGCGWGSLSLWMAERYPNASITAVSNSASQRNHIEQRALTRSLDNLRVITEDMNDFMIDERFDRVVSVEMFEHMRNYESLLARIASWLEDDGLLFVHVFCHREAPYEFETSGPANWMGRHFFTGGIMPSEHLIDEFDHDMRTIERWRWDGTHYEKTAEAWLDNLDRNKDDAVDALARSTGREEARRQFHRWRIFFMACAETFGFRGGAEWFVSHTLLEKSAPTGKRP